MSDGGAEVRYKGLQVVVVAGRGRWVGDADSSLGGRADGGGGGDRQDRDGYE